ncbi:hypothetical protein ACVWYH_010278 [Bradyrhizobium sp. GM24.11]
MQSASPCPAHTYRFGILPGEPQTVLGFTLCFCERLARRKEVRIQAGAIKGGEGDIATAARGLKCVMNRVSGKQRVLRP